MKLEEKKTDRENIKHTEGEWRQKKRGPGGQRQNKKTVEEKYSQEQRRHQGRLADCTNEQPRITVFLKPHLELFLHSNAEREAFEIVAVTS